MLFKCNGWDVKIVEAFVLSQTHGTNRFVLFTLTTPRE
jgi:hypothetical protein